MSKLKLGIAIGIGAVLAVIGVGAIINWTLNYQAGPPTTSLAQPAADAITIDIPTSGASPLIGKHVKMREGWAIKYPANAEGIIVAVPGSDDYCGTQGGTSVRWIDFPSKDPSCHWMSELEIE